MAHRLSINNGRAEMAYVGTTPWHELGTKVDGLQRAGDMLRHAGMEWTVSTQPLTCDGRHVSTHRVVMRDDTRTFLGVVGEGYPPIQNTQCGEIMDALISEGAVVEIAGALDDGKRCWMLANIAASNFEVVSGDRVALYVLLAWGHDGRHGIAGKTTPTRVVCHNTLSAALGNKWSRTADFYIKHTRSASIQLDEARKALGIVAKQAETTAEAYRAMAATPMNTEQVVGYFGDVFPKPEAEAPKESVERWIATQDKLATLYEHGKGVEYARGTAWNAYNAVTEYVDHVYPILQSGKVSTARLQSAALGTYAEVKARALSTALTLVG